MRTSAVELMADGLHGGLHLAAIDTLQKFMATNLHDLLHTR